MGLLFGRPFSLKVKIAVPILTITLVAFALMAFFTVRESFETAEVDSKRIVMATAEAYSQRIRAELDGKYKVAHQLYVLLEGSRISGGIEREKVNAVLKQTLVANKGIFGVWATYEKDKFDGKDQEYFGKPLFEKTGAFGPYWNWGPDGKTLTLVNDVTYDGTFYTIPKQKGHPLFVEPYFDSVTKVLMTSPAIPVFHEKTKELLGVVGIDIALSDLVKEVEKAKPFPTSIPFLVSSSFKYATHVDSNMVGKDVELPFGKTEFAKAHSNKESFHMTGIDPVDGEEYTYVMTPIVLADGHDNWAFFIKTPQKTIMSGAYMLLWTQVGLAAFFLVLITLAIVLISSKISKTFLKLTENLKDSEDIVRNAIEQVSLAGQNLANTTSTSAASLQETVASLEEMASIVKLSSDNAHQAASLSQTSSLSAEKGETEMRHLLHAMTEISEASRKIEEITAVIDDLSFQTNLLALNAAVEAARAGEQGKGFAVVADAVRSLAQKSAEAAKGISSLISDSVEKIESGTQKASAAGEVLQEIVGSVQKVSSLNKDISSSSSEQAVGIAQISQAMNHLDATIQINATSSQEIAATVVQIHKQSEIMSRVVDEIKEVVSGKAS